MKTITQSLLITLGIVALLAGPASAGQVSLPNVFQANTPAVAGEVNANFNAVKSAVDDNDSRITGKQNLVTETCPAGQSIRTIYADGTVECETDDIGTAGSYSSYHEFGSLNLGSVTVDTTWTELNTGGPHSFTKNNDETVIEVLVNSKFGSGTFSGGASGIRFQVRIDGTISYDFGNDGSIGETNKYEFLSIFTVFQDLDAGSHTVSIWAMTNSGSSSDVLVDPGGWGGKILVKEIW